MKMSFTSPPSPAWSMMRIVMLRCNGAQVHLKKWSGDFQVQDLFDEVKRPPTPQLETPSSILSMEQVFFATWIMVVFLVCMMMINIIHIMLILILTSRLKNLFSIFLLAALAPPGPLPMAQINMVMMIINSDGQDNGNGHYCHDHNDDQSNIDHDVSSSESSPSSSPIFLRIAILIWPSPKKH